MARSASNAAMTIWPACASWWRATRTCPLGLVDAAVIACAERNGGPTLTLDQRDFGVVSREVEMLPSLLSQA